MMVIVIMLVWHTISIKLEIRNIIDQLESIDTVSEENNNFCDIEGVVYSKDKTTIVKYPTGRENYDILEGVTSIGDGALHQNK